MLTLDAALVQLDHRASAKRRAAAGRLRRLAVTTAGPSLLRALRREVLDPRTWETQYEMVMALGACDHRPAVPFLSELAQRPMEHTSVYAALGDSIVRLRGAEEGVSAPVRWCLSLGTPQLTDGALRAVAMLRAVPDPETVDLVLDRLVPLRPHDGLRFWAAAAAAGWPGERVRAFLESCAAGPRTDVADAAATSLEGTYQTYRPL
ncbi:HEAT repeat domain-containing protein [Streptomyces sp. NBC_00691]|uniref:HEAT repeat domain-containing protein n=1 Tax=Streptomyces sp. NBC_00691 TaxID=2903671 RepID=UPI002E3598F8|nr:HEAT repeat domain-containing protein [Streptomyces sp. NBC_00691]